MSIGRYEPAYAATSAGFLVAGKLKSFSSKNACFTHIVLFQVAPLKVTLSLPLRFLMGQDGLK